MERLELIDPNEPEKGYRLRHPNRNRFIPEYEHKLGELSVTDGVPIIREAVEEPDTPDTTEPAP